MKHLIVFLCLALVALPLPSAEAPSEVDLSGVRSIAVLPVEVKIETPKRVRRTTSGPRVRRRADRQTETTETTVTTDAEKAQVAEAAGKIFREGFHGLLGNTGYHTLELSSVDRLVGAPQPGESLDPVAAGKTLGVDAVLVTTVLDANNERGGLLSETTLAVSMRMIVVGTGQVAWDVEEKETARSGALWGAGQVVEIAGSFGSQDAARQRDLRRVAFQLARRLAVTLPDPHRDLDTPVVAPEIASASVTSPARIGAGEALWVVAVGSPGRRASFDLVRMDGTLGYADLPMHEVDSGQYIGHYQTCENDPLPNGTVSVRLTGDSGVAARTTVSDGTEPARFEITGAAMSASVADTTVQKSPGRNRSLMYAADYRPGQPRRVAVLPFSAKDGKREGAETLRQTLYGALLTGPFRLVDNLSVDRAMTSLGLPLDGSHRESDLSRIAAKLGADALLVGRVTQWDRTYMAVQTNISTGMHVELVDAASGHRLASIDERKSKSKGLAGIPTGIGAVVVEPIRGMSKSVLYRCAYDLADTVAAELCGLPAPDSEHEGDSPIHAAKYTGDPAGQLAPGDHVRVAVEAEPGLSGYFSVGEVWTHLPLRECRPGHYEGTYEVRPGDYFQSDLVDVVVVDRKRQAWSQPLSDVTLSSAARGETTQ